MKFWIKIQMMKCTETWMNETKPPLNISVCVLLLLCCVLSILLTPKTSGLIWLQNRAMVKNNKYWSPFGSIKCLTKEIVHFPVIEPNHASLGLFESVHQSSGNRKYSHPYDSKCVCIYFFLSKNVPSQNHFLKTIWFCIAVSLNSFCDWFLWLWIILFMAKNMHIWYAYWLDAMS